MKYFHKDLKRKFLSRIKTWDRPFNTIKFYYTPKLYQKIASTNKEAYSKINFLHKELLTKIHIKLDNNSIAKFEEIEYLQTIKDSFFVKTKSQKNRIELVNFILKKNCESEISIDHKTPLDFIINQNLNQLCELKKISEILLNGRNTLNLSEMQDSYKIFMENLNLHNIDVDKMINEIEYIYYQCELELLPRHVNSSKGKKKDFR
ncbi:hypothetical protein K5I29_02425 [Flavobacterium agricola]|uniref:Uncharacterized protein n=1 Tax=Flavobacterium agricola TaxID=2870839 RepID=A0ABY6M274_9FLAO|nr:hypothetical protein [Flavobacterium agricola]UYW01800.1 hypothetical protein K5I29_02425 [Flavobacterium agricola]